jgi:hypothetical protein
MGAAVLKRAEAIFSEKLPEEFGWVAWLTPENLRIFAGELLAAARRGDSDDDAHELLDGWQATAELDHSPEAQDQIERNRQSGRWAPVDEWIAKQRDIA